MATHDANTVGSKGFGEIYKKTTGDPICGQGTTDSTKEHEVMFQFS
jgi:hypothetical protein